MPNTALQGFPYPALTDPANGPVGFQNLAQSVENKTVYESAAAAPPPHREGRIWYQTDTDKLFVSDGAAWQQIWQNGSHAYNLARVASGSVTVNIAAAVSGQVAVVFPVGRFTGIPIITTTTTSNTITYISSVGSLTAAGCNVLAFHKDSTATTASVGVHWMAMQTFT